MRVADGMAVDAYGVVTCPLCALPNLILFKARPSAIQGLRSVIKDGGNLMGGESVIEITAIHPAQPSLKAHDAWPGEAGRLLLDAQTMQRQRLSPSVVIATCRSVLEIAVKALGGTGPNLRAKIDSIRDRGLITEAIAAWSHALRLEGNEAVHETVGTEAQAQELIEFSRMLLDVAFTLPETIRTRSKPPT